MSLKNEKALVVFSGGQDSTTCLYWALERFSQVEVVTFAYGQRHKEEIQMAETFFTYLGIAIGVLIRN